MKNIIGLVIGLVIIFIIVILLILYVIKVHITKKKIRTALQTIDSAKDNIGLYLSDKKDLILKTRDLLDDEYKESFDSVNFDNYEGEELISLLDDFNKKFDEELINNDNYLKDDNIYKINGEIRDNNSCINASLKFYNDSVNNYYELKKKCHGIRLFCRFKKFNLYEIKETSSNLN